MRVISFTVSFVLLFLAVAADSGAEPEEGNLNSNGSF